MPEIDPKESWPTDGKDHRVIGDEFLYKNKKIENFIYSDQRTILIATKGMGKTLLLRVKKQLLEKSSEGHLIIPRNDEADYPQFRGSLSNKGLEDSDLWKELWVISIVLSILSHNNTWGHDEESWHILESASFNEKILNLFKKDFKNKTEREPSFYLNLILNSGIKVIQKIRRLVFNFDFLSKIHIKSSVCLFIDAFDHTLTSVFPKDITIWRNAQIGLISAIHNLRTINSHIKVYASVRQEAWAAFLEADREVIKGQSIVLEYSKQEIRDMFLYAINKYTNYSSIEGFIGLTSVRNARTNNGEDLFEYIFRHSVGTPRSLMIMGGKIYEEGIANIRNNSEKEILFRKLVNSIGSDQVFSDYLVSQRKPFLSVLNSEEKIINLARLIPSNVLRGKTLIAISKEFFRLHQLDVYSHSVGAPFEELLNIGLLGVVQKDLSTNKKIQSFKKPHEFDWGKNNKINPKRVYLIHPSLNSIINKYRENLCYINPLNIISSDNEWIDGKKVFPSIFISYSSLDNEVLKNILPHLEEKIDLKMPCDIWYDKKSIEPGMLFHEEIEKGLDNSNLLFVFFSSKSIDSSWANREWRNKQLSEISKNEIQVICCLIDNVGLDSIPTMLRSKQFAYLNGVEEELDMAIEKLASATAKYLKKQFWGLN